MSEQELILDEMDIRTWINAVERTGLRITVTALCHGIAIGGPIISRAEHIRRNLAPHADLMVYHTDQAIGSSEVGPDGSLLQQAALIWQKRIEAAATDSSLRTINPMRNLVFRSAEQDQIEQNRSIHSAASLTHLIISPAQVVGIDTPIRYIRLLVDQILSFTIDTIGAA